MRTVREDSAPGFVASLCEDLGRHVPEIVERWAALVAARARHGLPSGALVGEETSALTRAVLDAALCAPNDSAAYADAVRTLVRLAARHGALSRMRSLDRDALFTEYDVLREAVWRHVRPLAVTESAGVIVRVDDMLSIATRASLQGYHRPELEASGRWAGAIEALVQEALVSRRTDDDGGRVG